MSAIILLLLAASAPKPMCNAANQGRYWPDAANGNSRAVRELYQAGALELCLAGEFRYKWTPLSVHISRLGRKRR